MKKNSMLRTSALVQGRSESVHGLPGVEREGSEEGVSMQWMQDEFAFHVASNQPFLVVAGGDEDGGAQEALSIGGHGRPCGYRVGMVGGSYDY